jgi:hypothetical protein
MLPLSLEVATAKMVRPDSIAREIFGDEFVDHFGGTREHEIKLWNEAVTNWEGQYSKSIMLRVLRNFLLSRSISSGALPRASVNHRISVLNVTLQSVQQCVVSNQSCRSPASEVRNHCDIDYATGASTALAVPKTGTAGSFAGEVLATFVRSEVVGTVGTPLVSVASRTLWTHLRKFGTSW